MKYLLQIYSDDGALEAFGRLPAEEQDAILEEFLAISRSPGVLGGQQLQHADTATTVRVQGGEVLLSDGPFIDAKEHLGGFYIVEADELDAALEIAARIPVARMGGAVEVRPVMER
jgi:hypothetical protein